MTKLTVPQMREQLPSMSPERLTACIEQLKGTIAAAQAARDTVSTAICQQMLHELEAQLQGKPPVVQQETAEVQQLEQRPVQMPNVKSSATPTASAQAMTMAKQHGIDLSKVQYSGKGITVYDVQRYLASLDLSEQP